MYRIYWVDHVIENMHAASTKYPHQGIQGLAVRLWKRGVRKLIHKGRGAWGGGGEVEGGGGVGGGGGGKKKNV